MRSSINLEPKLSSEIRNYQFDFRNEIDALGGEFISLDGNQNITLSVYSGVADPSAATMLQASLTLTSVSVINARIGGGITGNIYQVLVTVTSNRGNVLYLAGLLAIVSKLI